jgi:hypothetical protein
MNRPTPWWTYPALTNVLDYRKINTSPNTIDEKDILKKPLTNPPVKKIELETSTGIKLVARGKPVTIKDALDAIYKQYKKKVSGSLWATSLFIYYLIARLTGPFPA